MGVMGSVVKGQNPVEYSTGFEVGDDTAWTFYGGPNRWHIGTAVADSGSRSLYISNDGGISNAYTNTSTTCAWAVKELTLGGGMYRFSFRWRSVGESVYDYLRVALVPDTVQPDTTMITTWQSAREFAENLPDGWICLSPFTSSSTCYLYSSASATSHPFETVVTDFVADSGQWKLVCIWVNDPSVGNNPPASVDNIVLQKFGCRPVASVSASVVGYDSVYVHWTPAGEESSWLVTLNDSIVATVSDTTYGFNHLMMLTHYTIGIRALCTGGDTTEAVSIIVHTGGYVPLPFSEDFNDVANNTVPPGWISFAHRFGGQYVPVVQQHELDFYTVYGYPITAMTPLLQGPANGWRVQFDVWMQTSRTHDFGYFGPFEVELIVDTNHMENALTLLTVAGGENAGWHTYTFETDTMVTHGGAAWLLFRWLGNYCHLKMDNLIIQPLTDSLPHVLISGPTTVLPEDTNFFSVVHDAFYIGGQPHDTVVWHSTMAQAGNAQITSYGDTLSIVYSVGGTDTLTAVATNVWGSDTAHYVVGVTTCSHTTIPYYEDFENGAACWKSMSTDGDSLSTWNISDMFVGYGGSHTLYAQFTHGGNRNAWAVSPAIELPVASDLNPYAGITLSFRRAMLNSLIPADFPIPTLEVLVSTTGRQSVENFTDTLYRFTGIDDRNNPEFPRIDLDLTPYVGQTVWIAFRFSNPQGYGNIWLDDIRVLNGVAPVATLSVPTGYERTVAAQTGVEHPVHLGDAVTVSADLLFGDCVDVNFTWHSTMVDAGEASMIPGNDVLTINYLVEGVDTITVVADNHFGVDTTYTTVTVINCTAITEFPYTESFDTSSFSAGCWQVFNPDTASFVSVEIYDEGFLFSWTSYQSDLSAIWAVSPQITIPDDSVVYELSWIARGYFYSVLVSPAGCDETVCFTDLLCTTDTDTYSLFLGDYAGQTIRIAFMVPSRPSIEEYIPTLLLDEVSIRATDSLRVGITQAEGNNVQVYARDGRIMVDGADGMEVRVYDMIGRQMRNEALPMGVYVVKIGCLPARKVIVSSSSR